MTNLSTSYHTHCYIPVVTLCFLECLPTDAGGDDDEGVAVSAAPIAIDPYDLADPVDMLGKLPKNFFDQLVCSNACGNLYSNWS